MAEDDKEQPSEYAEPVENASIEERDVRTASAGGGEDSDPGEDGEGATAIQCLAAIANHHGIDTTPEGLLHRYALDSGVPDRRRLLRIAKDIGLKAKLATLSWKDLTRFGEAFPVICRLRNGNYVILTGYRETNDSDGGEVAIYDPLASSHEFLYVGREKMEEVWAGEALLIKRKEALFGERRHFDLKWFLPEIRIQSRAFRDVAIASIFLHAIALVTPIFFQIVVDKVLVHEGFTTLQVLGGGIVVALLFAAIIEYLRSYLLLNATSKIDVRVSTRTFGHLLKLPLGFFEHSAAGVVTKHMQQTKTVREFLTGRLLLTLLDSVALFIFLPFLFFYSPVLTGVVLIFSGLIALVIGLLIGPFARRLKALYEAEGRWQALLVETIHGMQTVKSLALEPVRRRRWDDLAAQAVSMHFRVGKISTLARATTQFLEKLMNRRCGLESVPCWFLTMP